MEHDRNQVDRPELSIVGRAAELSDIDTLLASVASGTGRMLLIEGEAGIGKSHLARAARSRALELGMIVAEGAADELGGDRPGDVLAAVADELGTTLGGPRADAADAPLEGPSRTAVEAFVDAVEDAVAVRPVVLVIEDLQWADALSIRGIAAVARRIAPLALGLVATLRPVPRPAPLHQLLDICHRGGATIRRLTGLDRSAVADLAHAMTGGPPGPSLRVWLDRTAGNPLFVIELVSALLEDDLLRITDGLAVTDATTVPLDLAATLRRRLSTLPATTLELLRQASLLGGEFGLADLAVVADRGVVDVAADLRSALDAGFVTGDGQHLEFRHDLIREAVYLASPDAVRRDLHTAAGRALAAAGASSMKVARQFAAGAPTADLTAVDWLLRAARDAVVLDTSTAASLTQRALDLAPPAWDRRASVEADLVELLAWSGRVDEARALGETLLRRSLTDVEELRARRALGAVLSTLGDLDAAVDQLTAAAAVPGVSTAERAVLRNAAAGMRVIAGQPSAAARRTAVADADSDDRLVACWAQHTLGIAAVAEGAYEEALRAFERSRALLDAGYVAPLGFLIPHTWVATAHYQLDDFDGVRTAVAAAHRRADRRGDVGLLTHAMATDTGVAWVAGRWDDATAHGEAALALADETVQHVHAVWLNAILALVAFGRGDRATAEAHLASGQEVIDAGTFHLFGIDLLRWAQAQLLELDGEPDTAYAMLDDLWRATESLRGLNQWRVVGPDLIRLARHTGDSPRAAEVADDMEALAARSTSPSAAASGQRGRALATGDPAMLVAAAEMLRSTPQVVAAAATCVEAGALLLEHDRDDDGMVMLDQAAAIYDKIGADGHMARVDAVARRTGRARRPPTARVRPRHGWASLSAKEREVVALVADGLSNPQIAARLFISRRTVESHVSHVFRKLGLHNRTQLATAATERLLAADEP